LERAWWGTPKSTGRGGLGIKKGAKAGEYRGVSEHDRCIEGGAVARNAKRSKSVRNKGQKNCWGPL